MLYFAFLLGTITLILQSTLFPNFVILGFAPFLALIVLTCHFRKCLTLSLIAGAILDLLSNDPMGVHALNYALIPCIFFRYKRFFSYDQPLHLSLFTLFISFTSTLIQLFILFLFDRRIPFTGEWVLGDLVLMPIADAVYALVWFAYPLKFFQKGRVFWLNIKKKLFPSTP